MRRIGGLSGSFIVIVTSINPKKDHENVRLLGKGGGRFYGKVADGQEKERERAQRWKKVEREKERKGFDIRTPFQTPITPPKSPHSST